MVWTTFGPLTTATLGELDSNFNILSGLTPIPCTIAGTNTLTMTSTAGAATILAYANYMRFTGVAANTNSSGVTAQFGSLAALTVYKDTPAGPVVLVGNEIVANNEFTLVYDSTLNGNVGGFHLKTGGPELVGQTITIGNLVVTGQGSIASQVSINATNLVVSNQASIASQVSIGGAATIAGNIFGLGNASIASQASIAGNIFGSGNASIASQVSVGGILYGAGSASFSGPLYVGATGQPVTRVNSATISLGFSILIPQGTGSATVTVSGAAINDAIMIGPPASVANSVVYTGHVSAASSVVLTAANIGLASVTIPSLLHRVTAIGNT